MVEKQVGSATCVQVEQLNSQKKKTVDLLPDCRNIKKRYELPRHGEIKDFFLED
jgi:hypothetical protein